MSPRRKGLAIRAGVIVLTLLLFIAVALAVQSRLASERAGEWVEATRVDLITGVEVSGTIQATDSEQIGPPQLGGRHWNFKISMMSPEGSEIEKGEPVLGFDASELQDDLQNRIAEADTARTEIEKTRADLVLSTEDAELALAQAESGLRKANLALEAPEDLMGASERKQYDLDRELASAEVDRIGRKLDALENAAAAEIRMLETRLHLAEEEVRRIRADIDAMTIRSPRNGTVVYVTDHNDEKKKVGDSVWRMQKVIEIPDLSKMRGEGEVDEADISRLTVGQNVVFELDAQPDREFQGTITSLGNIVQERSYNDARKILRFEMSLDPDAIAEMRPGMRFRGIVELDRAKQVLAVPPAAITFDGETPVVSRRRLFETEKVVIEPGRRNDDWVEVRSGLRPGDEVLVAGQGSGGNGL